MTETIIKAEDYGIEVSKANELTIGLNVVKAERDLLITEFEKVSKLEVTKENLDTFKTLRLKIVKNRTQGIQKWHKANKEFFLTGGKFVDAIKNKESQINEEMESKLIDAEKYFENIEIKRLSDLQDLRVKQISLYIADAEKMNLSQMDDDVWEAYFSTKKKAFEDEQEAIKQAEIERIEKEKKEAADRELIRIENERLKAEAKAAEIKEEAARLEREKIETERLEKEAKQAAIIAEKERKQRLLLEAETAARKALEKEEEQKREALFAQLKAKEEAELKRIEDKRIADEAAAIEAAAKEQAELSKGDADKVLELVEDISSLKTKYSFKSAKNKKMYSDVATLIDRTIEFINKK